MKQRINVSKVSITETSLQFEVSESIIGLEPAGQILVDSDHYSFIYLMEEQDDYTYIVLPEQIWPHVREALEKTLPVKLIGHDQEKELTNFHEELSFIISNIKGNSNYGNEMVAKVEEIF